MVVEPAQRYGSWTGEQVELFLAAALTPLRLSIVSRNGPLIVPVWHEYRAGSFWSCSPSDSLLVSALHDEPGVAFDVSTNDLPYRGVRGRGIAHCAEAPDGQLLAGLIEKYLADTNNALAHWLLNRDGSESLIEVRIDWLTSWDFSERMAGIEKISKRLPDAAL